MAVKAVGWIDSINAEADGSLTIKMDIFGSGYSAYTVPITGFDPGYSEATLNSDLVAYIKEYAETNFGTEFGLLDSARLLNKVSAV